MKYTFSYSNPLQHIIDVSLEINDIESEFLDVHLPAWRPGRYTIQNFAKHILKLEAFDEKGEALKTEKLTKDHWRIKTKRRNSATIKYNYYAFTMDAGNSWLDETQLYINFINCALYVEGKLDERCTVKIQVPSHYQFATGLEQIKPKTFAAPDYYKLVDSPLVASAQLKEVQYKIGDSEFHLWLIGDAPLNEEKLIEDFSKFTELQINVMGEFPCSNYHFIYQCLPYPHYHGVEHWNSTMITIGPSHELSNRPLYKEFLGVSSHELFHTWNVIRLRPKEMTPYTFDSENYHKTGFVTEGVTTYYGDLFLKRSGVFTLEEYLVELNKMLERHFLNEGRRNMSVADSSFDLWLDGYEKGVPGRKVSIYNEGALLALMLDLKIRLKWNNEISLDDVMQLMWEKFGRDMLGYTYKDYKEMCEEVYGEDLTDYFQKYVSGTKPFETELSDLFKNFGLEFYTKQNDKRESSHFGIKLIESDKRWFIDAIAPNSPAEKLLSIKDEILNYSPELFSNSWPVDLEVNRFGRKVNLSLPQGKGDYFSVFQVRLSGNCADRLKAWLN